MIDKSTAFTIAGNDYRLCDKEGKEYVIIEADFGGFTLGFGRRCYYTQIGTDYFILAHPMENLTKEINGVVHLVELAKIAFPNRKWELNKEHGDNCKSVDIEFYGLDEEGNFDCDYITTGLPCKVKNQLELFNYQNK